MPEYLVRSLFDGPLDIVGDVHGEIDALMSLLRHLGYDSDGMHPDNRRLVFVGDLTDRGPDSPAVVDLVQGFVRMGRAQCLLGNHELNILLGQQKHDNHWFFGEPWALDGSNEPTPAILADDAIRRKVVEFFGSLPLVLQREDLRVVHACWDDSMVEIAKGSDTVVCLYKEHRDRIDAGHDDSDLDEIDRGLDHQNLNPVTVLSSGKERRIQTPFTSSGKLRYEQRVPWWNEYEADQLCVFGHYSFFKGGCNSSGNAICIDYAVAKRWMERNASDYNHTFKSKLAALRHPEMVLVFDDGETELAR